MVNDRYEVREPAASGLPVGVSMPGNLAPGSALRSIWSSALVYM